MILGDKISLLRKQNGWSQEDLAEQLSISRQSVSKWESGASIPDLDKIIKLSSLFGVSTDYLLKDEIEEVAFSETDEVPEAYRMREISLAEANDFLNMTERAAKRIAVAVAACILSPVCLLLLGGIAEYKKTITEDMAAGVGVSVLLLIIAAAVAVFVTDGIKLSKYDFLEKETFSLQYGVAGIIEKRKETYEPTFRKGITIGTVLCILGVLPMMLGAGFFPENEFLMVCFLCVLLAFVAIAVILFIRVGLPQGSFEKLLQTGEYTPQEKELSRRTAYFPPIYWCLVTAVYLGYSFWKDNWYISWVIWPVAAVLFAALYMMVKALARRTDDK